MTPSNRRLEPKKTARLPLWGAGILLLAQFTLAPPELGASRVVALHDKDNGSVIDVEVNSYVQIELSGTPTTGFWWHFEAFDREFLELVKEETRDTAPQRIEGGRILGIWTLKTQKAGSTFLKMSYYRLWEGPGKARRTFSVQLRIRE